MPTSAHLKNLAEMLTSPGWLGHFEFRHRPGNRFTRSGKDNSALSKHPAQFLQGSGVQSGGLVRQPGSFIGVVVSLSLLLIVYPPSARAQAATATHDVQTECGVENVEDWTAVLRKRIAPPSPEAVEAFRSVGVKDISSKTLSDEEWDLVQRALSRLPELHRCVLVNHLGRMTFLDLPPGLGSALVSKNEEEDAEPTFDMTLRLSLLHQTLTDLLTMKEAHLFDDDGSGVQVRLDAGSADALSYVLVHETTHIVDEVLDVTGSENGRFRAGTWVSDRELAEPHASSLAASTWFRQAPKIPRQSAPLYYKALKETPFVSFYATASAYEDLAELTAWQQLAAQPDQTFTVTVADENGATLFEYAPLEQPAVQQRFRQVQEFLDAHKTRRERTSAD